LPKRGITIFPFGKGGIRGILRIVGVVLNPPLKKGDIGGFAFEGLRKFPLTPHYKGGNTIYGQALNEKFLSAPICENLRPNIGE
jgi:hypothetical protein